MEKPTQTSNLLPVDLEAYNEIELTEEEVKLALLAARQRKSAQLKQSEYLKKLRSTPTYPKFTSEELFEQVKQIPNFTIDSYNEGIIWNLCHYFTNDPRGAFNIQKGLCVYGPVGCGKTTLMQFFRNNQVSSYCLISTRQVSYDFAQSGHSAITRYRGLIPSSDETKTFGQKEIGVCFDDLGTEVDKKHYGNESNVMAEILLNRYDFRDNEGKRSLVGKTHVTTNLNTTMIEERYGERVRSRMREMFNVVIFDDNAPDRRK